MKEFIVKDDEAGKRIDSYLSNKDDEISRVAVQRLIKNDKILVNGKSTKASYKVQKNDSIKVEEEKPKEISLKPQDIPVEIIYEDKDIIVVNKPKGMVVHPANGNPDGTLVNSLMSICKDSLSGIGGEIRPGIVHRLDKDTSGVIVVAKNDKAHINLSEQIKNHKVEKTYIALVKGVVKANEATIDMPIGRSTKDRKKMAVTKTGKNAITHFEVIKRYENFTHMKARLETGRTHQIRVHALSINHPLLGDEVYGPKNNKFKLKGQTLHAKKLGFIHPTTKEYVEFDSELPKYFQDILNKLK